VARALRFATFLAPRIRPLYELVVRALGERTGLRIVLVTGESLHGFEDGRFDGGFVCGLPYVRLAGVVEPLAAPVLRGPRYGDRPVYWSDVIVSRDSEARSFADLRGRSFAFNEPDSHSGCGVVLHRLASNGEGHGFFGEVQQAGFHQESIRRVAAGEVEASAVDSQVLAIELREQPELRERLRVIDALGPSTIQPVVAARCLPGGLKEDLRTALLSLDRDAALAEGLAWAEVSRFAPVDDSDYDDVRGMLAACRRTGLTSLR
jgi:phosphonate transport system substrate-binding protein